MSASPPTDASGEVASIVRERTPLTRIALRTLSGVPLPPGDVGLPPQAFSSPPNAASDAN